MNYLFDENTPPAVARCLSQAFYYDPNHDFYWIDREPFHRGMKDKEIFAILIQGGWGIIGFDKFRHHPIETYACDCLVLQLINSAWAKMPLPERCWKFIRMFSCGGGSINSRPLGVIYSVTGSGGVTKKKNCKKMKSGLRLS